MSLLPSLARHHTVFDALSEIASYQHENQQLLSRLVTAHTTGSTGQAELAKVLGDAQTKLTAAVTTMTAVHQRIADSLAQLQKSAAQPPVAAPPAAQPQPPAATAAAAGPARISPMALMSALAPLHEIEKRLADVRIADKPARDTALGHYAAAVRDLEERLGADKHLKALQSRVKALVLKPMADTKEAIERETLEKFSALHELAASAVTLHAAAHNPQNG